MKNVELRVHQLELSSNQDKSLTVSGYVNKTEQLSQVLGSTKRFVEKIAKGAFNKAIKNAPNGIDFLAEHNSRQILSTTKNGSLRLKEDETGLYMEAKIVPTSYGKDYFELINSRVLQNMSFGFRTIKDSWKATASGIFERTIEELELFEISVVRNPAYSQSTISARGIELINEVEIPNNVLIDENIQEERNKMKTVHTYDVDYKNKADEIRNYEIKSFNDFVGGEERALQTAGGGHAVIPETVADIIVEKLSEDSQVFRKAKKFPSVSGTLKIPKEAANGIGSFVGEGENLLEDTISLGDVELNQKRVGAYIALTNHLINDSAMNMADYIPNLLAKRTFKAIEKSILRGNGSNEFKGIVPNLDIENFNLALSADNEQTLDILADMVLSIHPEYLQGAQFIMSRTFFNRVAKLKDIKRGQFYLQNGVVNGKPTYTLLGLEVVVSDSLDAGNVVGQVPCILGNLEAGYAVMVKKGSTLKQIQDTQQALRGSVGFMFDAYMDGVVYNEDALSKLTIV